MLIEKCKPSDIDLTKDCSCNLNKKPTTMMEGFDEIVSELRHTFLIKQRDYGAQNIREFGLLGLTMRANDKLSRLKNLVLNKKEADVKEETISETIKDLSNYSIMTEMFVRGYWDLPLE